ncbi:Peptidase M36, fungalysin [Ceraceosorus bombacis]|uniref:Extracellular metalloproteinase n=1 Tax=Ceraceosorus bombacis TaxID=401625 RepID=A0A0P1BMI4_9BASI|nr:Peptidase M36, fungalysin [Ceraceosorus bombacis]
MILLGRTHLALVAAVALAILSAAPSSSIKLHELHKSNVFSPTGRRSLNFGAVHARQRSYMHAETLHSDHAGAALQQSHHHVSAIPTHLKDPTHIALYLAELESAHREMLQQGPDGSRKLRVLPESYTDDISGISRIFVKQSINGIDVDDASLQLLVGTDGQVISYSSTLYNGPNPVFAAVGSASRDDGGALYKRDQLVLGAGDEGAYQQHTLTGSKQAARDPRYAALYFMAHATPNTMLAMTLQSATASPAALEVAASPIQLSPIQERDGEPFDTAEQAGSLQSVPGTTGAVAARRVWSQDGEGGLRLAWRLNVPMDWPDHSNFYQATVDIETGDILNVHDWNKDYSGGEHDLAANWAEVHGRPAKHQAVADAATQPAEVEKISRPSDIGTLQYRVLAWPANDPTEANRTTVAGWADSIASPFGWHSVGNKTYDYTRGNNVWASAFGTTMSPPSNRSLSAYGKLVNGDLSFIFPFDWRKADKAHEDLAPEAYANASVTNLFYHVSAYHDLFHRYGFTAQSGNFEEYQEPGKGKGGDAILAFAQSAAGINNADFTTPPDGQPGRMRMYKWKTVANATQRDGDFEAGVVLHEATHGLSIRLTGPPSDSSCLGWGEASGMGEGLGDIIATIVRRRSPTRDIYPMGSWVSHNKNGIRRYPYSTNLTLSPETYSSLNGMWEPHSIGEVWAAVLYQVEEGLRGAHGWHPNLFPPVPDSPKEKWDEFYLTEKEIISNMPSSAKGKRASRQPVPRHGNTLFIQVLLDALKTQPCRPSFLTARDAFLSAEKALTGGRDTCLIWERFAQRGLGTKAKNIGSTPWGGGIRTNSFEVPDLCNSTLNALA